MQSRGAVNSIINVSRHGKESDSKITEVLRRLKKIALGNTERHHQKPVIQGLFMLLP